jgi:ATP-grasp domain, R2K clade family 2
MINKMKIVIESLGGKIVSDYCFKGWLGAVNSGHDVTILPLPKASLMQLKESKPMPIGSVSYMEYFFNLYGIEKPLPLVTGEYEVVNKRSEIKYPKFVKPLVDVKKFTGFVAKSERDFNLYPELEDWDGPYFVREPFEHDIVSEWRCFVHKGRIVNCSYYNGSKPYIFPDVSVVVSSLISPPPIAYTVDVAVLSNGETVLVELNDMWAIGPYGCPEDEYFLMLKDRWVQLAAEIYK